MTTRAICSIVVMTAPESVLSERKSLQLTINGTIYTAKHIGESELNTLPGVWKGRRTVFECAVDLVASEIRVLIEPVNGETSAGVLVDGHKKRPHVPTPHPNHRLLRDGKPTAEYYSWFVGKMGPAFTLKDLSLLHECSEVIHGFVDSSSSLPHPLYSGCKCLVIGLDSPVTVVLRLC